MQTTLVIILGPLAVGKMTVGQQLCEKTGFKLFHNHMTIDALTPIFDYGHPAMKVLIPEFRFRVMEEAVKNHIPGLVHTFVWGFQDGGSDTEFMVKVRDMVATHGGRICFVELQAPLELRKERAVSENRRRYKPGNVQRAGRMVEFEAGHQLDSQGHFPFPESYLRIDNASISAEASAEKICLHFGFPRVSDTQ